MPVLCISSINAIMFSYEFQFLEFSADCTHVDIRLKDSAGNAFFEGSYVPDSAGKVTLYDVNEIIDAFIGNAPSAGIRMDCVDVAAETTQAYTATVLRSSVAYNMTASQFLSSRFMTSDAAPRHTAPDRYECLNFYATAAEPVTAEVVRRSITGGITKETRTLRNGDYAIGSVILIDVSPVKFASNLIGYPDDILEYTVKCGSRKQRYIVKGVEAADPAIAYRNRFNVWDTFYFTGTKESDPQFERSQAWINGQYITYDVKEVMQFKAMTGILVPGMEEYLHDIVRSPEVRLLDSSGAMRDLLTVMDCDLKAVNDDNALNRFAVTYRHADKVSAKSFAPVAARIFDNSFDDTYE